VSAPSLLEKRKEGKEVAEKGGGGVPCSLRGTCLKGADAFTKGAGALQPWVDIGGVLKGGRDPAEGRGRAAEDREEAQAAAAEENIAEAVKRDRDLHDAEGAHRMEGKALREGKKAIPSGKAAEDGAALFGFGTLSWEKEPSRHLPGNIWGEEDFGGFKVLVCLRLRVGGVCGVWGARMRCGGRWQCGWGVGGGGLG